MNSNVQEHARFLRDPMLDNLEVLHATYVTHTFAPHMHEGFVIGIVDKGAETFLYRRNSHVAPLGSIVLINPGEMHTGSAFTKQGWSYRCLYPAPSLLQRAASELTDKTQDVPFFSTAVTFDPELSAQLSALHSVFTTTSTALERESYLLWTFAQLISRHADNRPQPRSITQENGAVRRVRSYIDEHFAENISLEHLAHLAHLSQFHLLRVFKNDIGLPPHAYQTYVRIMRAKQLLSSRFSPSLSDVGLSVGFADQSHFSKHFKRIVGVPPGSFIQGTLRL